MSSWHSYSSIFNLGHKAVQDLLKTSVNVEEKLDGSQFSFGLFNVQEAQGTDGTVLVEAGLELRIRSKGAVMLLEAPEKMFSKAAETVKELKDTLHPDWTYRGEYLAKPKHNALMYDRVPKGNIILFDIEIGEGEFLKYEDKKAECDRIGLECVPLLYQGRIETIDRFREFLTTVSVLGGQNIEGVVVKPTNYDVYGRDKKLLMGKFVSEAFKEVHKQAWGESNPSSGDILTRIGSSLGTQARWQKALQHLKEAGKIEDSVRDIGLLMKEIPEDIKKEEEENIKELLFSWAWPHLRRMAASGCPAWYKDHLLRLQFERDPASVPAWQEAKLDETNT